MKAFDYDWLSAKPIAIDRFILLLKAIDLHLLKMTKEEEGEHIFIKVIWKIKKFSESNGLKLWDYVRVVTEEDSNLVFSTMKAFENDLSKKNLLGYIILHY
jgi:hypothetical protein